MTLAIAVGCGARVTVDNGAAAGAGGSTGAGGATGTSSCDLKTASSHICATYDFSTDATGLLASAEASACKSAGGTSDSCPTASALGTCTITAGGVTVKETFYGDSTPAITAAEAEAACAQSGGKFQ